MPTLQIQLSYFEGARKRKPCLGLQVKALFFNSSVIRALQHGLWTLAYLLKKWYFNFHLASIFILVSSVQNHVMIRHLHSSQSDKLPPQSITNTLTSNIAVTIPLTIFPMLYSTSRDYIHLITVDI